MVTFIKGASFDGTDCSAVETDEGFAINASLDDCGFEASHENGVLTFSNTIVGEESENDLGIILGNSASFTVSCQFVDERNSCQKKLTV